MVCVINTTVINRVKCQDVLVNEQGKVIDKKINGLKVKSGVSTVFWKIYDKVYDEWLRQSVRGIWEVDKIRGNGIKMNGKSLRIRGNEWKMSENWR